jgi:hypothetical protein
MSGGITNMVALRYDSMASRMLLFDALAEDDDTCEREEGDWRAACGDRAKEDAFVEKVT